MTAADVGAGAEPPRLAEPVRVLSDLHLGHKVSRLERVAALRPLVEGMGTVVFNGDTWQELAAPFRLRSSVMLAELQDLCAREGAAAVFLPGNHDPGWPGPGWLGLSNNRILVMHGDALCRDGSPWKREILHGHTKIDDLWRRHPAAGRSLPTRMDLAREMARALCSVEYPHGRHWIQRAVDAALPPQRAWKMIAAWASQAAMGARFCETYVPEAEVLVIGHFHRTGCWNHRGRIIINTGSFTNPGRSHFVLWHNGWLSRGEIIESPASCRPGRITHVWRLE